MIQNCRSVKLLFNFVSFSLSLAFSPHSLKCDIQNENVVNRTPVHSSKKMGENFVKREKVSIVLPFWISLFTDGECFIAYQTQQQKKSFNYFLEPLGA